MPTVTHRTPSPETPLPGSSPGQALDGAPEPAPGLTRGQAADPLAAKRAELQQHLTQLRQLLAQLDAQRVQAQAAFQAQEGGCAVLGELLTPAAQD